MDYHLQTQAVHAGRDDLRDLGVHAPPLDFSTTHPVRSLASGRDSIDQLAEGAASADSAIYSRLHNQTVHRYEVAFARMEGADDGIAFASGMAAITAVFQALRVREMEEGVHRNHIVAVRPIYGCTDHLLSCGLLGYDVDWVEPDQIAATITEQTALVVIETPANPTLHLVDIADVVRQAGNIPVMVDNTFATPVLQLPLALGATFSVHSGTKYLGGHGDVLSGLVATDKTWAARIRQVRILTGANLHPMAAYLLHRSLPTLPLRVLKAQENAVILAGKIAAHPAVSAVYFPGFGDSDPTDIVGRQMKGPGSVIAFEMKGGFDSAGRTMLATELFLPAVSLGTTDSLIEHPAGLTHRIVSEEGRDSGGITEGLLRVAVGIEHVDDLWKDLEHALDQGLAANALFRL
ncbi:MAG: PLP-dependent transferase [Planctomycetes bacterium]|nr:PLP-dependent transferase [Planctomycetota bacterium]MCP4772336.1 PLP-dependent transferase [Planctomycetota bacterium]MCP4861564.1 PLP-dependent transferase [Planctomycetota bacterium]